MSSSGSQCDGVLRLSGKQFFLPARVSNRFEASVSVGVHGVGV